MSPSTGRRPTGLRELVVLGAFAFGLLGSLIVPLTDGDGVTDPDQWADAVRGLGPTLSPGTTVLIQPPWRDDVLDHFDALAAEGKPVLPAGVEATVALARAHDSWPGRVVLVADTSLPLPDSLEDRLDDVDDKDMQHRNIQHKDGLLIAVIGPPARDADLSPTKASLLDSLLDRAKVTVTTGKRVTRCVFDKKKQRHGCPGEPEWMYVAPHNMSSGGQSKRCLWAHPAKDGTLAITFPQVTLTGGLELQHALADGAVRNGGSPVDVRVLVDGEEVGRSRRSNAVTFAKQTFKTASGEVADVTFEVTARHDGARHHCLTARLVKP